MLWIEVIDLNSIHFLYPISFVSPLPLFNWSFSQTWSDLNGVAQWNEPIPLKEVGEAIFLESLLISLFHSACSLLCSETSLRTPGEGKLTSPPKLNHYSLSRELVNFTLLLHLEQLGVLVLREIIGHSAWNPFTFLK